MSRDREYSLESYESYYGEIDEVMEIMEKCPTCGGRMMISHYTDRSAMMVRESRRCPECGLEDGHIFHMVN